MIPFRKPVLKAFKQAMSLAVIYAIPLAIPKQVMVNGPGSVKKIPRMIMESGGEKPLVVTDKTLMKFNVLEALFKAFDEIGMHYTVFDGVEPNPSIENIEDAYAMYKMNNCDSLVGFGGGSAMDCAKVTSARILKPNMTAAQMKGYMKVFLPIPKPRPYLVAVPTTAGTGAETTIGAVVSDHKKDVKYTIDDPLIRPRATVLDSELTKGLPPFATACTAVDALSHCIEGYIGTAHNKKSDDYARKAIQMIFENIDAAVKDGNNIEARSKLLLAAYYGGMCLNTSLTGYVHGFCHKLGAKYNLVHGRLIGAVLPVILEWYGPVAHDRLAELADLIGVSKGSLSNAQKAAAFIETIRDFDRKFGIELTVPEIREEHFKEIAKAVHAECIPYPVPVIMDNDDVFGLLKKIKGG